jgi:galactonate dehydratase
VSIRSVRTVMVGAGWKNWVFVELEATDGSTGVGEATMGWTALPVEGAVRELIDVVVGLPADDPGGLRARLERHWLQLPDPVHRTAIAALESAAWDLVARRQGQPLWAALGGDTPRAIPVYANGWYRTERDPLTIATAAGEVVARGYRGLKLDPFGASVGTIDDRELALATEILAAIRERVGPRTALMVDAHDRFDVPTAIRVARALEPFGLEFLEAPCDSTDIDALDLVARGSPVPIAAGERLVLLRDFEQLAARTPIRLWQPESLTLGVAGMRALGALAHDAGAAVLPHNARGPVCTALNVQLGSATGPFRSLEVFVPEAVPLAEVIGRGLPPVHEGTLSPTRSPGLGIDPDWVAAADHPYSPGYRLDLTVEGWERRLPGAGRQPRARCTTPGSRTRQAEEGQVA